MPNLLKKFSLPGLFVLLLLSLLGCQMDSTAPSWAGPEAKPDEVLARMGDVALTLDEFQQTLTFSNAGSALENNQPLLKQFVEKELLKKYLRVQAQKIGMDKRPQIAFLMQRAEHQVLIDQFVASKSQPPSDFPAESLIQDTYKKNLDKFQVPPQVHLAQIFMGVTKGATKKDKELLRKNLSSIAAEAKKKGGDFAALAAKHSRHKPSAANGGDMGWIAFSQLLPEFRQAMKGMKVGEIRGPVATAQGFHLLRLLEHRPASAKRYAQVRDSLVMALRTQKSKEQQAVFLQGLSKKTPIKVENKSLLKLLKEDKVGQ